MILEEQREKQQKLHRELMTIQAEYDDLNKMLANLHKIFVELWKMSDEKLNDNSRRQE